MKPSELLEGINIPDSMNNWKEVRKLGEKLDKRFIDKEKLKKFVSDKIKFHWNEIQKIITEKEKGKVDINLDILYKIHNNCYDELIQVNKKLDTLGGEDGFVLDEYQEEQLKQKEAKEDE